MIGKKKSGLAEAIKPDKPRPRSDGNDKERPTEAFRDMEENRSRDPFTRAKLANPQITLSPHDEILPSLVCCLNCRLPFHRCKVVRKAKVGKRVVVDWRD
jgi:hypothetical protein